MLSEATWQAALGHQDPGVEAHPLLPDHPRPGGSGIELYDMAADPHEQHNVAYRYPEVAADLDGRLRHWVSAQLAGRHDPMLEVIDAGLPAVARLNDVIAGQVRPRGRTFNPAPHRQRRGGRRRSPGRHPSGAGRCRTGPDEEAHDRAGSG